MITIRSDKCLVEGIGSVVLKVTTPQGSCTLNITRVLYTPKFMVNIISMERIKVQMLTWDHSENWLTLRCTNNPSYKNLELISSKFQTKRSVLSKRK